MSLSDQSSRRGTVDRPYSERLSAFATQLEREFKLARSMGLYGLADRLEDAANSCDSWADGLREEGR